MPFNCPCLCLRCDIPPTPVTLRGKRSVLLTHPSNSHSWNPARHGQEKPASGARQAPTFTETCDCLGRGRGLSPDTHTLGFTLTRPAGGAGCVWGFCFADADGGGDIWLLGAAAEVRTRPRCGHGMALEARHTRASPGSSFGPRGRPGWGWP